MALTVQLTSFSKPFNSTAQPSTFTKTCNCLLKDNCGITEPTFLLRLGAAENPTSYNYLYVSSWGRYYYVKEWTYIGETFDWAFDCELDVLATFKSQIGSSTQYVLRTSVSAQVDGDIIDNMYPQTANVTRSTASITSPFQAYGTGTYSIVLGVIGKIASNSTNKTGINYYVLSASQFRSFFDAMFSGVDYFNIDEISFNLAKAIVNPTDYVTTCRLFPFAVPTAGTVEMHFGWWNAEIYSSILSSTTVYEWQGDITIPKHPQAATRGNFLNVSASRYELFSPLWGNIPINPASIAGATQLHLYVRVDCISGVGDLLISANSVTIEKTTTQVSTEVPIGQVSQNFVSAASSIAGAAGSAMSGNVIGLAAGLGDAAAHLIPQIRISGTVGNTGAYFWAFILTGEFNNIVDANDVSEGRPCCKMLNIGTTGTGYYQIRDAEVSTPGNSEENQQLKDIMESGFFYA